MNQSIPPDMRMRRTRERFRKAKRRQLARMLIYAVGVLLLLGLLAFGVNALRSVSIKAPKLPQRQPAKVEASPHPQLAVNRLLRPAPVFTIARDERYFCAMAADGEQAEDDSGIYSIGSLAAFDLATGDVLWEQPQELSSQGMLESSGYIASYRQYLAEPPRLSITVFNATTGEQVWQEDFAGATAGQLIATPRGFVACYRMQDGHRIVGLAPDSGAKAWGARPKLSGLAAQFRGSDLLTMQVQSRDDILSYHFGNVLGIIDISSGKLLREYSADDIIHRLEIEPKSKCGYIVASGSQPESFALLRLPFKGEAQSLLRYRSASGSSSGLLSENGFLCLAYNEEAAEGGGIVSHLYIFNHKDTAPIAEQSFTEGYVYDVLLKQAEPQQFLVLTRFVEMVDGEEATNGAGNSHIFRLSPGEQQPEQLERINGPVKTGQLVKGDWLLLTERGDLYSFRLAEEKLRKLKRPRFDFTEFQYSPYEERAVLLSTPAQDAQPAAQQQLIVYE